MGGQRQLTIQQLEQFRKTGNAGGAAPGTAERAQAYQALVDNGYGYASIAEGVVTCSGLARLIHGAGLERLAGVA